MNEVQLKIDALLARQESHLINMAGAVIVLRRALIRQETDLAAAARVFYAREMAAVNEINGEINRLALQLCGAHQALAQVRGTIQ